MRRVVLNVTAVVGGTGNRWTLAGQDGGRTGIGRVIAIVSQASGRILEETPHQQVLSAIRRGAPRASLIWMEGIIQCITSDVSQARP